MNKEFDVKQFKDSCDAWVLVYHREARDEKDIDAYEQRIAELEAYISYLESKNV